MIRIRQLKVDDNDLSHIKKKCASILKIRQDNIKEIKVVKESIDARKNNVLYVYELDVLVDEEEYVLKNNTSKDVFLTPIEEYTFEISGDKSLYYRPVIVGMGPAGLFCAYVLSENGYKPIIIDRGENVDSRISSVEEFWNNGTLNINSNVQFGEGGAGTFSDGKLNTLKKDKFFRCKKVFDIFVECGAPKEILTDNKPHIGTDLLRKVVINIRKRIISMGGEFRYNTCLTDINILNNKISSIVVNNKDEIKCEILVLAIGHSARDTFEMLYNKKMNIEAKPFAVGVRIQHPQEMINTNQYGCDNSKLPPASYKLTYKASTGRGVYTFCMCPGGYVVNSSSENNELCINGMSNYKRESKNSNSAVIVTIGPKDFGDNPLDGVEYQRKLEKKAYDLGCGKIPVQLYKDFKNNINSNSFIDVDPIFKGNYTFANLNNLFDDYIVSSLIEGIDNFDNKIKGFARGDSILAGVESRTSSPIRLIRNDLGESSIEGIYPCGEGAGYAGGITSSAMDGLQISELIAKKYMN